MAYGAIATPAYDSARLPSVLAYNLPRQKRLLVFPLTLDQTPDGLLAHMAECFRLEVESESSLVGWTAKGERGQGTFGWGLELRKRTEMSREGWLGKALSNRDPSRAPNGLLSLHGRRRSRKPDNGPKSRDPFSEG